VLKVNFFPELPWSEKPGGDFYTVGYRVQVPGGVPRSLISQLMFLCAKLRRCTMAWQTGAIYLEGIVESLVYLEDGG